MKKWANVAMLVIGLCVVSVTGCIKSPEKIAKSTDMLFNAIRNNDIEQAKLAIKGGANLKATRYDEGVTPLIYAINHDRDDIVELLIKSKADVNAKDIGDKGRTPIIWTVYEGLYKRKNNEKNTNILTALINSGVDINAKDNSGYTALIWAAKRRNDIVVTQLIKAGADLNVKDNNGETALMIAASYGSFGGENIVEQLINAGADVNAKDNYGATALIRAIEGTGWSSYSATVVKIIINAGADVNARDNKGKTALTYALNYNYMDILSLLKTSGAIQ